MSKEKIDWKSHIELYRSSGKTLATYCDDAGLKISSMRNHLYKKVKEVEGSSAPGFREVRLLSELTITLGARGELSLRGFGVAELPTLIRAWADVLQS